MHRIEHVGGAATRPHARRWARAALATATALVGVAATVAIPVTTASAAAGDYVALGDSYAAGQEIGGAAGTYPACKQSVKNYPRVAAARIGLDLVDRSCSKATLPDLFGPQGDVPPQAEALSASTRVVTLTMGGNDLGFAPVLTSCLAVSATGPLFSGGSSCREKYTVGGVDTLSKKVVDAVAPALRDAVARIKATAPAARVVVVGYPTLMPDAAHTPAGGCFAPLSSTHASFPFITTDLDYIHGVQTTLDQQSRSAVEKAGAEYVSLMAATTDHSSCSADPYIEQLHLSGFTASPASMHPNEKGLAVIGGIVSDVLAAPKEFRGVTGKLFPRGGDRYQLQIWVPSATLLDTPQVTAEVAGRYVAHVSGEHGWYLSFSQIDQSRVYYTDVTVRPGETVTLKTASGAVQTVR